MTPGDREAEVAVQPLGDPGAAGVDADERRVGLEQARTPTSSSA